MDLDNEELEATKQLQELSADELFKNIGYDEKSEDNEEIKYQDSGNEDINIIFLKKYKVITGFPTYDYFLDMDILQAINKKVSELGWIE